MFSKLSKQDRYIFWLECDVGIAAQKEIAIAPGVLAKTVHHDCLSSGLSFVTPRQRIGCNPVMTLGDRSNDITAMIRRSVIYYQPALGENCLGQHALDQTRKEMFLIMHWRNSQVLTGSHFATKSVFSVAHHFTFEL